VPWTSEERTTATAIYFLLEAGQFSRLHRIKSDEVWAFHSGQALDVVEVDGDSGKVTRTRLGADIAAGDVPTHVVKAGLWFGARPAAGTTFSLVSCFVSPGFHWRDFEMHSRREMAAILPAAAHEVILELTPPDAQ